MKHNHEHCHDEQHCQCKCGNCSCCRAKREGCHHEHGQEGHDHNDFSHQLIELADHAWMELLQEKIKDNIRSTQGTHLEELAKFVSESNAERWKHKLAMKKACCDFKERMNQFFFSKH